MTTYPNCNQPHHPCSDSAALSRIEGDLAKLLTLVRKSNSMSTQTLAEIETLKADLATEIAAIGPAINASVAAQLVAAGVDDATAQTALAALDKAVTDETASLAAMVAPAPPAS